MQTKPAYRVRLFLAVDLVGSTAFKAVEENQSLDEIKARPKWVSVFDEFYSLFPLNVKREYESNLGPLPRNHPKSGFPKLWKTIGDEVILCCRVVSRSHVSACVEAFLKCLEEYSKKLRDEDNKLDVKGNMWLATFPAPNTSIPLIRDSDKEPDITISEEIEVKIDENPHLFDFLGKAIDTGFRLAKHSSASQCTLTTQLAYLLVCENLAPPEKGRDIHFSNTEIFKGVNDGTPYPCLSISTETRSAQVELLKLEHTVSGKSLYTQSNMKDYLEKFMEITKIENIWLPEKTGGEIIDENKPNSYRAFEEVFESEIALIERQDKQMKLAEEDGDGTQNGNEIPEDYSVELIREQNDDD